MDNAQILAVAGSIIVFLGGIVLAGIRATVSRLEAADQDFYRRIIALETSLAALQSAHNTVMSRGGHDKDGGYK